MKKLLGLSAIFMLIGLGEATAQSSPDLIPGIEYYDTSRTRIRLAYHYILQYTFKKDRTTGQDIIDPNPTAIRYGPCIMYRQDGTIEATGEYKDNRKSGTWKYYDTSGKNVVRTEII